MRLTKISLHVLPLDQAALGLMSGRNAAEILATPGSVFFARGRGAFACWYDHQTSSSIGPGRPRLSQAIAFWPSRFTCPPVQRHSHLKLAVCVRSVPCVISPARRPRPAMLVCRSRLARLSYDRTSRRCLRSCEPRPPRSNSVRAQAAGSGAPPIGMHTRGRGDTA